MKSKYLILSLLITSYFSSIGQRFVFSEDSLIKAQTFIFEADGLSYTNQDTLCFFVKGKQISSITPAKKIDLLDSTQKHLSDISDYLMMRDSDELSHLVMQSPVPIALEKVDKNTYLFIGYRRFKSPVTILHHVWLLKKKRNKVIIEKKLVYFKNDHEVVCSFNKKTKEISIFPFYFSTKNQKILHVFSLEKDIINTKKVEKSIISSKEYNDLLHNSKLIIYDLPNGTKKIRRKKSVNTYMSKIKVFKL